MSILKTAVQLPVLSPISEVYGGMTTQENKILFENGSILDYLPNYEGQSMTYGDTWGCVSHSAENAFQVLATRNLLDYQNKRWLIKEYELNNRLNFSDRDLVVLSGTRIGAGNSGEQVLKTAQNRGLISQTLGDWDMFSRSTNQTVDNYYSYKRSTVAENQAQEWRERMEVHGEWVPRSKWEQASKEGVLQLYVKAWHIDEDGKYYNPTGTYNHAVIMADYHGKKILDTYKPEIKEVRSWDDCYPLALKLNINEKNMEKPKLEDNTLVQEVTQSGSFGLYLNGNIIVGPVGELLATFYMRNNGDTKGKTKPLTLEQWKMFDKYNLKMEKL